MAGHYASDTKSSLEGSLGRGVCDGELYAAHFLGADSACRLIKLNQSNPDAAAATAFPQAASANRSVFYHVDGSPKSVREVYAWATKQTSTDANTGETQSTTHLNLRRSVSDGDTIPPDTLSMMLLGNTDSLSTIASFDSLPRTSLSLTSSMLDVLSSMNFGEQSWDLAA